MGFVSAVVRLVVAYDGSGFHGFAAQPGVVTVGGTLGGAIERVLHEPVALTCAGRTDSGVHAWGQVVSFSVSEVDGVRLRASLNGMLAPEIVVRSCEVVSSEFNARRSAVARTYRYTVVNRPVPDPFRARFAWWVPRPLDAGALRAAADSVFGEHDFASWCRKGPEGSSTVRRVLESRWDEVDDGVLRYEIKAGSFCWQMVRSLVGTLVDVGEGRKRPGDMLRILRAKDRSLSGDLAPPHGLCLWEVEY